MSHIAVLYAVIAVLWILGGIAVYNGLIITRHIDMRTSYKVITYTAWPFAMLYALFSPDAHRRT